MLVSCRRSLFLARSGFTIDSDKRWISCSAKSNRRVVQEFSVYVDHRRYNLPCRDIGFCRPVREPFQFKNFWTQNHLNKRMSRVLLTGFLDADPVVSDRPIPVLGRQGPNNLGSIRWVGGVPLTRTLSVTWDNKKRPLCFDVRDDGRTVPVTPISSFPETVLRRLFWRQVTPGNTDVTVLRDYGRDNSGSGENLVYPSDSGSLQHFQGRHLGSEEGEYGDGILYSKRTETFPARTSYPIWVITGIGDCSSGEGTGILNLQGV